MVARFLSRHVDSDQTEVRSAALDAVESCYMGLDMDSARIHRLLGAVNDKTKTLIDEVRGIETCFLQFFALGLLRRTNSPNTQKLTAMCLYCLDDNKTFILRV